MKNKLFKRATNYMIRATNYMINANIWNCQLMCVILIMSRFVEVSPVPDGTTVAKIREVFHAFSLHKVAVCQGKAFLEFEDANDIETLDFTFPDQKVDELNGGEINLLPEDFKIPESSEVEPEAKQKKDEGWFILPEKEEPKQAKPVFLVVRGCDADHVKNMTIQEIQHKVFLKFKVGRVAKWKTEVYIEFLDENQIELLDYQFPQLNVKQLGQNSNIDKVGENFDLQALQNEISQYETKIQKEKDDERRRKEELEKKAEQMEEIMKKKAEAEQKQKIAEEQIRKRKEQEQRKRKEEDEQKERQRAYQQEQMKIIEQKNITDYLDKKKEQVEETIKSTINDGTKLINNIGSDENKGQKSPKSLTLFWGVAIAIWGFYVIFA